nr:hypothetical protein [Streptomyces sp. CBMA156]
MGITWMLTFANRLSVSSLASCGPMMAGRFAVAQPPAALAAILRDGDQAGEELFVIATAAVEKLVDVLDLGRRAGALDPVQLGQAHAGGFGCRVCGDHRLLAEPSKLVTQPTTANG